MNSAPPIATALVFAIFAAIFALAAVPSLRRYLGLSNAQSVLLTLGILVVGVVVAGAFGVDQSHGRRFSDRTFENMAPTIFGRAFFFIFAIPLGLKFYRAWLGIYITDEEKQPGLPGLRAWLTPGNLLLAAFFALSAMYGFGWSFAGAFFLVVAALLACPLVNTIHSVPPQPVAPVAAPVREDLSPEREKVLGLLEAGKISAEESAELLSALAATSHPAARASAPLSAPRRLVLAGAALLLLGFFLPWFSVNINRELSRLTGQLQTQMHSMMSHGAPNMSGTSVEMPAVPFPGFPTGTIHVSGYEIRFGLGWLVLLLGLGAAALSSAATTLAPAQQRLFALTALFVGGLLLAYLTFTNLRHLNAGLLLTIGAYILEFLGISKPAAQPASAPAPAASHA